MSITTDLRTVGYKSRAAEFTLVQVECAFFGPFRDVIDEKTVHHETDAKTIGDLLAELERDYPELAGRLLDSEESTVSARTVVTVDGTNVAHLDGVDTALEEGIVVRLAHAVYGG